MNHIDETKLKALFDSDLTIKRILTKQKWLEDFELKRVANAKAALAKYDARRRTLYLRTIKRAGFRKFIKRQISKRKTEIIQREARKEFRSTSKLIRRRLCFPPTGTVVSTVPQPT